MRYDRKSEAEAILETDRGRLGDTFRGDRQGLTLEEQARKAGLKNATYSYNNRAVIKALIDGALPTAPTIAALCASRVRGLLTRGDLSSRLRADWVELEKQLNARSDGRVRGRLEEESTASAPSESTASGVSGISVYTLPHYLNYLVKPETGQTYLNVGYSSRDAIRHAGSLVPFGAFPEEPILLRIYLSSSPRKAEKEFHHWLRMAGHDGGQVRHDATNWFLTSTNFLDQIAEQLGLEKFTESNLGVSNA